MAAFLLSRGMFVVKIKPKAKSVQINLSIGTELGKRQVYVIINLKVKSPKILGYSRASMESIWLIGLEQY